MAGTQPLNEHVVSAARAGDGRAIESLVRGLADELMPLASALTGGTGEADALVGDTVSRAYERIDQLRDGAAIVPWARRILVRRFLDQRRWSIRRPQCSIEGVEVPSALGTSAELVDLRQAVAQLSREDRALLVLHYWQGLSIAECARELDVPEGTAKSRISRALVRLRAQLGEGAR
ncbi:MAG TPA: RNA polymerase sigma factor [Candidatus Limnocylindrales bacterium]|nr:RNA polymerase sigma factor [Candidatus Limnocylindrales bacterium]